MVFSYAESISGVKKYIKHQKRAQKQNGHQSRLKIMHNSLSSDMQFLNLL